MVWFVGAERDGDLGGAHAIDAKVVFSMEPAISVTLLLPKDWSRTGDGCWRLARRWCGIGIGWCIFHASDLERALVVEIVLAKLDARNWGTDERTISWIRPWPRPGHGVWVVDQRLAFCVVVYADLVVECGDQDTGGFRPLPLVTGITTRVAGVVVVFVGPGPERTRARAAIVATEPPILVVIISGLDEEEEDGDEQQGDL